MSFRPQGLQLDTYVHIRHPTIRLLRILRTDRYIPLSLTLGQVDRSSAFLAVLGKQVDVQLGH